MSYPYKFTPLADKQLLINEFKGKTKNELPTPCFIINQNQVKINCDKMLNNAKNINAKFRAHVKTHKTKEGTILQLGTDDLKTDRIIVSTLNEAWNLMSLVDNGLINDILFSLPVIESKLNELFEITEKYPNLKLRLMIDNFKQLEILKKFSRKNKNLKKWSVFIKINLGTNRAGLTNDDNELDEIIKSLVIDNEFMKFISLYGFYCHAGHAYGSKNIEQAMKLLIEEINHGNKACEKAISFNNELKLVISIGSTPTSHSSKIINNEINSLGELFGELELHAGNYPFNDLQQLGTGCISPNEISCKVLADILSNYPNRGNIKPGEQLINAGVLAISREIGPIKGFGNIISPKGYGDWIIGRLSQEHGILIPNGDNCKLIPLSTRVEILPQHSCITAACYPWYYIFDNDKENAKVIDIWVPFRAW